MKQYKDLAFSVCGVALSIWVVAQLLLNPIAVGRTAGVFAIITFALGIILSICDK